MDSPLHVLVTALGAQGDGVATTAEGEVHVPLALPGETVAGSAEAGWELAGVPSPERRIAPLCPHFPACGGCRVQHFADELYARWKGGLLAAAFAHRGIEIEVQPIRSVPRASRRRVALTGRSTGGAFCLGFHSRHSHDIVEISNCAVVRPQIEAAMPSLRAIAQACCPRDGAVRLSLLAADNGLDLRIEREEVRSKGARRGQRASTGLPADLPQRAAAAGLLRLTLGGETVYQMAAPTITIAGVPVVPPPGAFLQACAETEPILADLVVPALGKARRIADLFCGLGTLTLAAAAQARVLAVDADDALLGALRDATRRARGRKPVDTLRRDLFRDPLSARELEPFDAVILDPPRAGAQAQCAALAQSRVPRIVLVSCNPATLARDVRLLVDAGYALEQATPVDQFLFTEHLEAVAVLSRR